VLFVRRASTHASFDRLSSVFFPRVIVFRFYFLKQESLKTQVRFIFLPLSTVPSPPSPPPPTGNPTPLPTPTTLSLPRSTSKPVDPASSQLSLSRTQQNPDQPSPSSTVPDRSTVRRRPDRPGFSATHPPSSLDLSNPAQSGRLDPTPTPLSVKPDLQQNPEIGRKMGARLCWKSAEKDGNCRKMGREI
jgi:hypothetical protein